MTGSDDEFDDFLKRRKPVFRSPDDMFEPPAELDRVVLRHAREAIESDRPVRVFRNPRWAAPVALAASLLLAFTMLFYAGLPQKQPPAPEVIVQNIAERVVVPQTEAPMEAAPSVVANNQRVEDEISADAVVVDLDAPAVSRRESAAGAAPMVARSATETIAHEPEMVSASPSAASTEVPAWRRDAKTWLAEIARLRNAGDTARADAELAEYKRQQRAYAGAPDR
ncbi:MAG TPA: hypothetical protein VNM70_00045 [Burkholderiales bacterium]|nr:hypothetical protein [Burkholderiales bacterium]